ncbi:hypothetical protein QP185_05900 [Sphingomonas aerolata]|uniref:hypothetical protein n=1 Tax=Sphingomonas aerolata TaxID=185951 RepID=UPI002FE39E99
MLVLEFARHGSKILVEFEPIMACLTEISDSSLETIKSFGSKPPVDDSSNINLIKLYDEYASGQYLDAYSAAVKDLSIKPSSPLYELVVRSGAYGEIKSELNEGDGIAAQIFRAVSDMSLLAPGRDTASARLKKLSTSLGFTSIAAQLRSLVSGTRRFELNPVYDEADRVWAMTAPRNHPWHLALFEEILETSPEPEVVYSTSPSYIVEAVINGKIDSRELTALHLDRDDGRHLLYRGRYNAKMQNYELAAQLLTLASNSSNSLVALSGRIFLYGVLLKTNRLDAASNLLAEAYYANPNSWVEFDYSALITNASLDADLNATFQFANIAFVAMKHISQSYESVTSDAFDRVLDAHEVERPSELIDMYPDPSTHLIFF